MNRITVTKFVNSDKPLQIFPENESTQILIHDHEAFVYSPSLENPGTLKVLPLIGDFNEQAQLKNEIRINIQLTGKIQAVRYNEDFIGIVSDHSNELIIYDIKYQTISRLEGHIMPITALCKYMKYLVTGSQDLTIRFWEISRVNGKVKVKGPSAVTNHMNKITFLKAYGSFLISGSDDKTMKIWSEKQLWASHKFDNSPLDVCLCPFSQQIVIYTGDETLHFINVPNIIKSKKISIRKNIKLESQWVSGCQIDQSFLLYCDRNERVHFVEVNLCKIVHSRAIGADSVMAQGRAIFIGKNASGISLIKL